MIFRERYTSHSQPVQAEEIKRINGESKNKDIQYQIVFVRLPFKPGSVGVSCPDYNSPRYTSPKAPFPISKSNGDNQE
jgi:hypothetical protein